MNHKDHESFSLGFVIGVLTGATGLFLSQTSEGKEIRNKLAEEWNRVKKKLEDEGVISENDPGITNIISIIREKISKVLEEELPKKKKRAKKTTKRTTTKKKKTFKGV